MTDTNGDNDNRYVYCIMAANGAANHNASNSGASSGGAAGNGTWDGLRGIDNQQVSVVADGDLCAVVSTSQAKRYRLNRQHTLAHELVIEHAMAHGTVLPVKFGTVAENEGAILEKVLRQRRDDLLGLLDQVQGKVELGVKVLWNEQRIYADIVQRNERIRSLRDRLAAGDPNLGQMDRIRLGEMVEAELNDRRESDAEAFISRLTPLAVDVRRNTIYGEMMILNAAFLVETAREPEFDDAIRALDREWDGVLSIKYVGPLPPFNFVNLVITWN